MLGAHPNRLPSPRLALACLLACLAPAFALAGPVQKLSLMIPPGHSELDDLQRDYEKTSKDLEGTFALVQAKALSCDGGGELSKLVAKGVPWQKAQRERVLKSLNESTANLQTEIANLDQAAAEAKPGAVTGSKAVIAAGIDTPAGVIRKELGTVNAFAFRLRQNQAPLNGGAADCAKARDAFQHRLPPQANAVADRLKKLELALESHRKALNAYADTVVGSLSQVRFRTPASNDR